MKKTHLVIILCALVLALTTVSCNKTKTYAQYLKEETRAIENFISENRLIILDEFPANAVFSSNEFYRDPATGVYFNIIEPGDTTSANMVKLGEEVYVRFDGLRYFANERDTTKYSNMDPIRAPFPETVIYRGKVTVRNSMDYYSGTTPAWLVPLSYVGHGGKVRLIVPFNMGSSSDRSGFRSSSTTSYYDIVEYRLESQS
ncbi:MAG: DUF4827 family protein [Bacteroidia bacterium]|nr:DUF4827 family protein [Bacteroidia bacterium]